MVGHISGKIRFFVSFLTLLVFFSFPLKSQVESNETGTAGLIQFIEKIYGQDDLIFQGRFYQEPNPGADGNPYFADKKWLNADIFLKGRTFQDVLVRYNINSDEIIIQVNHQQYMRVPVSIPPNLIDSLRIEEHLFVNSIHINSSQNHGYYEKIYEGNRLYFLHYSKHFSDNYTSMHPHGYYSKTYSNLFIVEGESWTKCSRKREFLQYFNSDKKNLKKLMRKHRISFKKASSVQYCQLCKFADNQLGE